MNEVTDTDFQATVIDSKATVLVDFWAPWCGPCRILSPILDAVSKEETGTTFLKLNVDDSSKVAAEYKIRSIPTLVLFKNGVEVKRQSGVLDAEGIKQFIA
jgi:thioredoxin 1